MRSKAWSLLHEAVWSVYLCALIVFSLMPAVLPPGPDNGDKIAHFVAYALLTAMWPRRRGGSVWIVFGGAAGLGVLLELGQGILPTGRTMEGGDMLANALGAGFGLILLRAWQVFGTRGEA